MSVSRRKFMQTSALALTATGLGALACKKSLQKPNIIVLFSDELAPEYLSCYGGEIPTPHLDKLAKSGLKFTKAYSAAPMCTPSRFSLLTGKHPGRCNHPSFLKAFPKDRPYSIAWNTHIDKGMPTLPKILSANGYTTGMIGKCHFASFDENVDIPKFNMDDDPNDSSVDAKLRVHQKLACAQIKKDAGFDVVQNVSFDNFDHFPVKALRFHNFPFFTQGALDFIETNAHADKPFFLYAATTAVHGPGHFDAFKHDVKFTPAGKMDGLEQYKVPQEEIVELSKITDHRQHLYSGMAELDNHVKIITDKLAELNIEKETIIIFLADHNIEPGKATCYDKGNVIPFIINWPGKTSGQESGSLTMSVDVLPTALAMAGVDMPDHSIFDGKSVLPLVNDQTQVVHKYAYLESGYTRGLSDGKFKYIAFRIPEHVLARMKKEKNQYAPNFLDTHKQAHSQIAMENYPHYFDADQLYDLESDPYEQHNLADNPIYADKLAEMKEALSKKLATFEHPFSLDDVPFMRTKKYKKMAEATRSIGTDHISWYKRDHGTLKWPPVN